MNYSYFKPFSPSSIGGTVTGIERKTAKRLLRQSKTIETEPEWRRTMGERVFTLSGRRTIHIY